MGRTERSIGPVATQPQRLAAELRNLRSAAGSPSYRELATRTHFSRTALARAVDGRSLPSLQLVLAFATACGGDAQEWRLRWESASAELAQATQPAALRAAPPWPPEPVRDGADPEAAGCAADAVTVHARRLALRTRRHIIGQVELRYSPLSRAAWARFVGYESFNRVAQHQRVEIQVEIFREADGGHMRYREEYMFDDHYSDLLTTAGSTHFACATVFFDGADVADGETDKLVLR